MHFAMGAKNGLTLWCTSMSRHVMSKNALDSRIKEGTLGPLAPQISAATWPQYLCIKLLSQNEKNFQLLARTKSIETKLLNVYLKREGRIAQLIALPLFWDSNEPVFLVSEFSLRYLLIFEDQILVLNFSSRYQKKLKSQMNV